MSRKIFKAMRRILKYVLILAVIVILAFSGLLAYVRYALPNVGPPPDLAIAITPERVTRGKYLANHVMLCMDCHAVRDFSLYTGPPKPETLGAGGEVFDQSMGFPGSFISRNITPFGVGDWTDGELYRAITAGVSRDGSALFPIMPYPVYATADPEDIYAVIAYLRTLPAIERPNEPSKPDFPMNFIMNTMPAKAEPGTRPDKSDKLAYGKYITTIAACAECHTNQYKGKIIGESYAGGFQFLFPDGSILRSSNITPHPTGIGNWTMEQFVAQFKNHSPSVFEAVNLRPGQFQTIMPWMMYADMEEEDLEAIYTYLRTVEPVENLVEKWTPANAR